MDVKSRKAEQSAATRAALIAAARELFAERGYAGTATGEIVARARVTRGALYHHFGDKADLLRAVFDQIEGELLERANRAGQGSAGILEAVQAAFQAFLDACEEPAIQRIVLRDAPAVLGRETFRAIQEKYSLGALERALEAAIEQGVIDRQPVRAMARLLLSALEEAGVLVAEAAHTVEARQEVGAAMARLIDALRPS